MDQSRFETGSGSRRQEKYKPDFMFAGMCRQALLSTGWHLTTKTFQHFIMSLLRVKALHVFLPFHKFLCVWKFAFQNSLTNFPETKLCRRKLRKPKMRMLPDGQSGAWVMSVIRNGCWICRVLLASRWLSSGGSGIGRNVAVVVGDEGGGGYAADEIRDSLLRNLVDWLHVKENACGKRILNQHSLLPCQHSADPEHEQNASAANPYKHLRQRENYISMGAPDELGSLSFKGDD